MTNNMTEVATLAGGCFWCTEAVFKRLKGIVSVIPGYIGGYTKNPTYKDICNGNTGHAEGIQITFDPQIISYDKLLDIFWHIHNPTTLNQQGADRGTQYRSAIFYHSDEQKRIALESKEKLEASKYYKDPIVTEITEASTFFEAEDYHRDYYDNNPTQGYCQIVIDPKIKKLLSDYKNELA